MAADEAGGSAEAATERVGTAGGECTISQDGTHGKNATTKVTATVTMDSGGTIVEAAVAAGGSGGGSAKDAEVKAIWDSVDVDGSGGE